MVNLRGTGGNNASVLGTASLMGMHMVSGPIVGGLLGYGVDRLAGTWPYGAAVGLILGIIAGFRMVFEDFRYMRQKEEDLEAERGAAAAEGESGAGENGAAGKRQ